MERRLLLDAAVTRTEPIIPSYHSATVIQQVQQVNVPMVEHVRLMDTYTIAIFTESTISQLGKLSD